MQAAGRRNINSSALTGVRMVHREVILPSAENLARKTRYIIRSLPCYSPEGKIIQVSHCAFLCFPNCSSLCIINILKSLTGRLSFDRSLYQVPYIHRLFPPAVADLLETTRRKGPRSKSWTHDFSTNVSTRQHLRAATVPADRHLVSNQESPRLIRADIKLARGLPTRV